MRQFAPRVPNGMKASCKASAAGLLTGQVSFGRFDWIPHLRALKSENDELRGVFTVDWNQPAPDGSGKPLIANEVVHALIQHFDEHDLSNKSDPSDILGRPESLMRKPCFCLLPVTQLSLIVGTRDRTH